MGRIRRQGGSSSWSKVIILMKVISLSYISPIRSFFFSPVWLGPYHFYDFSPMTNKENGNPLEDEEEVKGMAALSLSLSLSFSQKL
jgi:hypothetical protein